MIISFKAGERSASESKLIASKWLSISSFPLVTNPLIIFCASLLAFMPGVVRNAETGQDGYQCLLHFYDYEANLLLQKKEHQKKGDHKTTKNINKIN